MLSADLPQSGPVCQGSIDSYLRICQVSGTVIGQAAIPVRYVADLIIPVLYWMFELGAVLDIYTSYTYRIYTPYI